MYATSPFITIFDNILMFSKHWTLCKYNSYVNFTLISQFVVLTLLTNVHKYRPLTLIFVGGGENTPCLCFDLLIVKKLILFYFELKGSIKEGIRFINAVVACFSIFPISTHPQCYYCTNTGTFHYIFCRMSYFASPLPMLLGLIICL